MLGLNRYASSDESSSSPPSEAEVAGPGPGRADKNQGPREYEDQEAPPGTDRRRQHHSTPSDQRAGRDQSTSAGPSLLPGCQRPQTPQDGYAADECHELRKGDGGPPRDTSGLSTEDDRAGGEESGVGASGHEGNLRLDPEELLSSPGAYIHRLQSLTLPPMPNFMIPSSPEAEDPVEGTTEKFQRFLELRRTEGRRFNQRLAESLHLSNPGLFEKQLKFAGLSERDSYLSGPHGVRVDWPAGAYGERLTAQCREIEEKWVKTQKNSAQKNEKTGLREIEFLKSGVHHQ